MSSASIQRLRLVVRGAVQGVGFRPFVFRLATELHLAGWVNNSPQGVFIEVEGALPALEQFLLRLERERPPRCSIQNIEPSWLDAAGLTRFEIRASETGGARQTLVLPDIATCPDCLREILDPANRRFGHAFANCTNCGPRFSLIEALPYDRVNTAMKSFAMCEACRAEFENPIDRRFHAQPIACPRCGPQLAFWDSAGALQAGAPLQAAARAIRDGSIVAVKGIGGFHLMCVAHSAEAVRCLRERKHREEKPFAVLFPGLAAVRAECEVNALEERLLLSPEAPVVALAAGRGHIRRASPWPIVAGVAPGNPYLGAMLPSNPLHHLLLRELGFPVVATSGNVSDEPICTEEREAVERLAGIADFFLVHDRPIARHVDDSIVRVIAGRELMLRRARGYAPLPLPVRNSRVGGRSALAVGAHLKNTVALAVGDQVFVSQHIGDLENEPSLDAFKRVVADLQRLYDVRPAQIACDAHPDYLSTKFAQSLVAGGRTAAGRGSSDEPPTLVPVQHHVAHVLSCMAENELEPPVLGVAWDGTGFGLDGTLWGGEFFTISGGTQWSWERVAHLRPFRLPGGEAAVKEPRRAALGLLFGAYGGATMAMPGLAVLDMFGPVERAALNQMLMRGVNSPLTSSIGRLFDAVAGLAGLRSITRFEGQSAMALEFAAEGVVTKEAYLFPVREPSQNSRLSGSPGPMQLDWQPMLELLVDDVRRQVPMGQIAAKFHNALVEAIVEVTRRAGMGRVVLTGGCFQNRRLLECSVARLTSEGFRPYWHQRVPPNDGGIALGQIMAAQCGLRPK